MPGSHLRCDVGARPVTSSEAGAGAVQAAISAAPRGFGHGDRWMRRIPVNCSDIKAFTVRTKWWAVSWARPESFAPGGARIATPTRSWLSQPVGVGNLLTYV